MREASPAEFNRLSNLPHASRRYLNGGKRSMTLEVTFCGAIIAEKRIGYTRGKLTSTTYYVNDEFLESLDRLQAEEGGN